MKSNIITLRLSDEEHALLKQQIAYSGMTTSDYIRSLIRGKRVDYVYNQQKLIRQLCILHTVLTEQRLDTNEPLMREVNELCRILY